jgi:hypothetical protein
MRLVTQGHLAASLAGACLIAGCTDFEDLTVVPLTDAGSHAPASSCDSVLPPLRPQLVDTQSEGDFTVVVRHVDLGDAIDAATPPYESIGYDLDHTCTTSAATTSCREPSWATADHIDGPGGRDNAFGGVLYQRNMNGFGSATAATNQAAEIGALAFAIRVRGLDAVSGTSGKVRVAYYGVGFRAAPDAGQSAPRWDGTDVWGVYEPWLQAMVLPDGGAAHDIDRPLYEDENAFVQGAPDSRTLVSTTDVVLSGAAFFHLSKVVLTATLVPSAHGSVLQNGTIAGRVAVDEFLHSLKIQKDPETNQYLCTNSPSYQNFFKRETCSFADINYSGKDDSTADCDAVSWAWRMLDSAPAALAGSQPVPPLLPVDPCSPGTSPADDHCAP